MIGGTKLENARFIPAPPQDTENACPIWKILSIVPTKIMPPR